MDLSPAEPHPTSSGFPRPRGDGPWNRSAPSMISPVSPPTRGWTLRRHALDPAVDGFPAHAGMDPCTPARWPRTPRFPRPRGDGPGTSASCGTTVSPPTRGWTLSPPTRGWTPIDYGHQSGDLGFPAHAGMDHSGRFSGKVKTVPSVSPPTRGWTLPKLVTVASPVGFPAHAGMDLSTGRRRFWFRRFPRPRGDGPLSAAEATDQLVVSPPTRGWTLSHRSSFAKCDGFPAHAGMDPHGLLSRTSYAGFPRPRGDGPFSR